MSQSNKNNTYSKLSDESAIIVKDLVKQYPDGTQALNKLSLSVKAGEIFTLLGPNGAGKSTVVHILTTRLRPTSGSIALFGQDLCKHPEALRPFFTCTAQQISVDPYLSLTENMLFQSKLYRIPQKEAKNRIQKLVTAFALEQYLDAPVFTYSGGIKRRLDLAISILPEPKLLFLDEPTAGMDRQSNQMMWQMLKKIKQEFGATIFMTTHDIEEAEQWSDHICIMKNGTAIVQDTPNALCNSLQQNKIRIRCQSPDAAEALLNRQNGQAEFLGAILMGNSIFLHKQNNQPAFQRINQLLLDSQSPFLGIELLKPTLEDVFLNLTTV